MRSLFGIITTVIFCLFTHAADAQPTFTAFGPESYEREPGSPQTVITEFRVLNADTAYMLEVLNGGLDGDLLRASSAVIEVNGARVFGPSDFNQRITALQAPVELDLSNVVSITVGGKIGAVIVLKITGVDADLPTITADISPAPNANGWNRTDVTVSFDCDDLTSGVASCPDPVLVEDEGAGQLVTGTATDFAGNTASTAVYINIDRTAPVLSTLYPLEGESLPSADPTVRGTISDSLAGVDRVVVDAVTATLDGSLWSAAITGIAGEVTIDIAGFDHAGNSVVQSVNVVCNPVCQLGTESQLKISPVVLDQFINGGVTGPVEILVNVFDDQAPLPGLSGVEVLKDYRPTLAKAFVRVADGESLASLVETANIKYVYENRKWYVITEPWQETIGQDSAQLSGYTGTGTAVAVLDDGGREIGFTGSALPDRGVLDLSIPAFGGCSDVGTPAGCRVAAEENPYWGDPHLDNHASYVARRVALTAPGADIAAYDVVFSRAVEGDVFSEALAWVLEHRDEYNIVAVNMSFATDADGPQPAGPYSTEDCPKGDDDDFQRLRDAGIMPIAGAGNDGFWQTTNDGFYGISHPACSPYVVSVGGSTNETDLIWHNSTRGPNLDLLAPALQQDGSPGTSISTPTVAGAWAVLQAALPGLLTLEETLELLKTTGAPVFDPESGLTFPRVQLDAALRASGLPVLDRACPCFTADDLNAVEWDIWCSGSTLQYLLDDSISADPGPIFGADPGGGIPVCFTGKFYDNIIQEITGAEAEACLTLIDATGTNQGTSRACRLD